MRISQPAFARLPIAMIREFAGRLHASRSQLSRPALTSGALGAALGMAFAIAPVHRSGNTPAYRPLQPQSGSPLAYRGSGRLQADPTRSSDRRAPETAHRGSGRLSAQACEDHRGSGRLTLQMA